MRNRAAAAKRGGAVTGERKDGKRGGADSKGGDVAKGELVGVAGKGVHITSMSLSSEGATLSPAAVSDHLILQPAGEDGKSGVFVDANFHVLYKEYNLRRSKTFLTDVKPPDKVITEELEARKGMGEKREGSFEEVSEAKRFKTSGDVARLEKEGQVGEDGTLAATTAASAGELKKPRISSPTKRGRKPSLSQSKKLHRQKQAAGLNEKQRSMHSALCCLCHRKDSASNLGFLYGPYKPIMEEDREKSHGGGSAVGAEVQAGGGVADQLAWVHEDCAVWTPGVCLVKGKLLGLHEAIADSRALVGD